MKILPLALFRRRLWLLVGVSLLLALLAAGAVAAARYLRARNLLQAAQAATERRDFSAAGDSLAAYLKLCPDDAQGWFLAARAARRAERFAEAEQYLEHCQRLGGVTDATRLEWDLWHVQQGDLGEAEMRLRATIKPEHPDALLVLEALARGFIRTERLADALQALNLWLSRQPDSAAALTWRGRIWERLQRQDEALADFRRAAATEAADVDACLGLARCLVRSNDFPAAVKEYEEARRRRPSGDANVLVGLARCRRGLGQDEEALRLVREALAREPENEEALAERGKVECDLRQYADAESTLREAVGLAPDDRDALYYLTECLRLQGRTEECEEQRRKLTALEADLRRLDEIIRAVAQPTGNADADAQADLRCEAAHIAFRLGKDEEGLRWLLSAEQQSPRHAPTQAALAEYYERIGQPEAAAEHRRPPHP
jgi:tetratricopeptide (TPR) repeat protein